MNQIDTRPPFFPKRNNRSVTDLKKKSVENQLNKEKVARSNYLKAKTRLDAKVDIPDSIKDFSRIKKAVINSKPMSNEDRIQDLKSRINNGTYSVDYDMLADRILMEEL